MWNKNEHEIPQSQFQNRIERVRAFALEHDLSGVVIYSAPCIHQWSQTGHVGYLTNWSNLDRTVDAMVLVPRQGEAVLLFSGVEYVFDQIQEVSWIGDMRLVSSPDPRALSGAYDSSVGGEEATQGVRSFGQEVQQILETNGCADRPVSIAGMEAMPAVLYESLKADVKVGIANTPDIVADLRAVKTPQEIVLMRKVAQISDLGYQTMLDVLEDGMQGCELTGQMDLTAKRLGADLVYHYVHSAPGGDLARGKFSIKAHDGRLYCGDYINVNAYVVHKGYWIQSDRAGTIGSTLGSTAGKALEANLSIQDEVLAAIRPGLVIGQLAQMAEDAAKRLGYDLPGGRIGHGQGLDYAEQPFMIASSQETLRPGHVFVLHVALGIPGTNILLNPIADLCHVIDNGVEVLNHFPRGVIHA